MLTSFLSLQGGFPVGAKIYTFDAGTSNARTAYKDGSNNPQAWTQPFFTDANGRVPPFWIAGTVGYRVRITTAADVQIYDQDNLTAEVPVQTFPTTAGYGLKTGDLLLAFDSAERAGFVKANGKGLGSTASGADYADDANSALFTQLYNLIPTLAVSGGRGASAAADFAAAKILTLPSLRGRVLVGLDTMGNTAANVLSGVTFSTGSSSALGSTGGEALHALTIAELPAHQHTGTTGNAGAHTPAGTIGNAGSHNHTGTTGTGGAHHHAYTAPQAAIVNIGTSPATLNVGAATLNTADENSHTHPFTTSTQPDHAHPFTGTAVADHAHAFTSDSTGSGTAHNNMPPFVLATIYIKV